MNKNKATAEIVSRFKKAGVTLNDTTVATKIDELLGYKVPDAEIINSTTRHFLKVHGIDWSALGNSGANAERPDIKINDINSENKWINVRNVKIVSVWKPNSPSIGQTGIIGDETGTMQYTVWATAGISLQLEEGKVYSFENVVTAQWQGKYSIKVNKNSIVTEITGVEVEIKSNEMTISGTILDVRAGSGLIRRCPECNRALVKNMCANHGKVDGVYDLRIKATLDNGIDTFDLIMPKEITEQITGMTLDQAKTMATEKLDMGSVKDEFTKLLGGKNYTVTGNKINSNLLVTAIEPLQVNAETIKTKAEAIINSITTATTEVA